MDQKWITEARRLIGTHEGINGTDNPKVVKLYADAGHPEVKHDAVPWCAAFVGACLRRAGVKPTGTLWALDYAKWGLKLNNPRVGCIATKKRDGGGHVFFVVDYDAQYVWGLGGNQSDQVNVVKFPRSAIYSYTWPSKVPLPADPKANAFRTASVSAPGREA